MSNTSISLEAKGELVTLLGGETHTYRFENPDPANPVVAMLSIQGDNAIDAMTTIPNAKMRISMCPDDGELPLGIDELYTKSDALANWAEALLELITNTDCNPDDPDEFDEVIMGAGMFLQSYRETVKKLALSEMGTEKMFK